MMTCSECGRAVSSKAAACVGCGAPIEPPAGLAMARTPPPTPPSVRDLRRHLALAVAALFLGLIAALAADHDRSGDRLGQFIAALLMIAGICWTLVTLVRLWAAKR